MCKHRNNVVCILRMALSAKMRWRLLHGGKNLQYGNFQWAGNAECKHKQINLPPIKCIKKKNISKSNEKEYENQMLTRRNVPKNHIWRISVWEEAHLATCSVHYGKSPPSQQQRYNEDDDDDHCHGFLILKMHPPSFQFTIFKIQQPIFDFRKSYLDRWWLSVLIISSASSLQWPSECEAIMLQ